MYERGIVSEVNASTVRVRVKFPAKQDLVSGWLDVLQRSTHADQDYSLPKVGNQVAVLLDETGDAGCVLGAVYSSVDPPPATSPAKRVMTFADGCRIEYDQSTHVLSVALPSAGKLQLCGAASKVALANLVKAELTSLSNDYKAHTHVAGMLVSGSPGAPVTGTTGAPVAATYSPGEVGSAQVESS
jgi:phage baseplate assembly protein V